MAIQKYQDSFSDLASSSFSTMLDRFFNDSMAARGRVNSFSPHVDAYETEKSFEIEAALPGMKREDIKVDFHQGRLTISGERHFRNEQNERRYHLVESSYGSFHRSFQLPDTVDASRIEASFENGMLHIVVPKDQQKTMRHQIEVRGGQSSPAQGGANGQGNNGQMSERVGQQATDVTVQSDTTSEAQSSQNTTDAMQEMQNRPQSSGVGS
ncbi:Hsp20/alpha crystallin family protein [Hymenobacter taeanensis]|uniref:Hsp20/alpha crystallin family protein n=1 Tax=Hymenobacter taeanensis TaxID=2735321 RepID=A0A6M6BFP6_9BACT|nr:MULTISPECIES: Hsp20/alpha crystallin family protein [Hymenobacter]QJX46648.1 Hsp20/alpha crystallin family protein [Hymenobacter taeanensis]UOQ80512.1 Hsp20/alpha crystallin family protein [Hymenobacter sp. 5414T-23]